MTSTPLIGVLAIQGDVREHVTALEESGARTVRVRTTSDLEGLHGLVLPGGESTTMSKLALADGLMGPLRQARAAGLPMYGSCAGMIMLADTITDARPDQETVGGLAVTVRRNGYGRQVDSFEADLDIPAIGDQPMRAVFIRAPYVEAVGPGVEVLARVDRPDGSTIVGVREGRLMATSFHPELTGDHRIHRLFLEIVQDARGMS